MKTGKVWGQTELLLQTPTIEIHRLTIEPRMACSLHKHEFKWNAFFVSRGMLMIEVQKNNYKLTDITTLGPGDLCTVKPNEFHRFVTGDEPCEGIEIYYTEPLSEDIVRQTTGGPLTYPT